MAPDSQRVRFVFGSSIAGTRPFGLRDSNGSGKMSSFSFCHFGS